MTLQGFSKAPFRVVDEINQGIFYNNNMKIIIILYNNFNKIYLSYDNN